MKTFLVILSDMQGNPDWKHPNELNGNSKEEVYRLIAQDVPAQNIIDVLTPNEYEARFCKNNGNIKNETVQGTEQQQLPDEHLENVSSENFANGNDFFNAMLQAGSACPTDNSILNKNNNSSNNSINNNVIEVKAETKYFEEGGIKFKLENGILYKKVWKQILLNGQKTPDGDEAISEYRLVSSTTKRLVSVEKLELQHLEWEEVKTH